MGLSRVASFALVLGLVGFVPKAIAEEPTPAPAPPPRPPAGPDDVRRQIHELELRLQEAKEAGREREEARIQATLEQLRRARKERAESEAARKQAEEVRRQVEDVRRTLEGAARKVERDDDDGDDDGECECDCDDDDGAPSAQGKLRVMEALLLGADGAPVAGFKGEPKAARRMRGGPGAPGKDGDGPVALERLKRVHAELAVRVRQAEAKGNRAEAEAFRAQLAAVEGRMAMIASGGRPGGPGGPGFGPGGPGAGRGGPGGPGAGPGGPGMHYYKQLEFPPAGDLERRLDALRQSFKILKQAGLDDRAKGLQEDIGRLEREQAMRRQQAAAAAGGGDGALVKEVHALREQITALRGEVKQLRAMLEKALSK